MGEEGVREEGVREERRVVWWIYLAGNNICVELPRLSVPKHENAKCRQKSCQRIKYTL